MDGAENGDSGKGKNPIVDINASETVQNRVEKEHHGDRMVVEWSGVAGGSRERWVQRRSSFLETTKQVPDLM